MKNQKIILVFGGTGFLGTSLITKLAYKNFRILVVSRNPNFAEKLKTAGSPGQIKVEYGDIRNLNSIKKYIKKADIVINLVGIFFEKSKISFTNIHKESSKDIAALCMQYKVERFIHISALAVDRDNTSKYSLSKLEGERSILLEFPEVTIFRPSVIFGRNDNFFNLFARMSKFLPFFPLIGKGRNLIQPVYVNDVSKAILASLNDNKTKGKIYELGGPEIYSFEDLVSFTLKSLHKRKKILKVPVFFANIIAFFAEFMPKPIITRDQIQLLRTDNKVKKKNMGFLSLKIAPKSIKKIVPKYLNDNHK